MVAKPKLLLADEPTGNLDTKTGVNVLDELRMLNTEYGTTVIIDHDDGYFTVFTHLENLLINENKVINHNFKYFI